jgi:hypothetical protein
MRSEPRLLFTEDEQAPPAQPVKTQKTNLKPKTENANARQRTVQADNGK